MSKKYKFRDNDKLYFVTFAVVDWIDLFVRDEYKEVLLNCMRYCQQQKGLEIYGWCIMTSHVHLIIGSAKNNLSDIMRDLKRHSSEQLHNLIREHQRESRKEWMLMLMERAGTGTGSNFRLWQPESHPIELSTQKISFQRLNYLHNNPVVAGFVKYPHHWLYCSATDYNGGKGLLEIILVDPMTITV